MSNSHKTALRRKRPSKPLRHALDCGMINRTQRVLDYGCGHGVDVSHMRGLYIDATGYDPNHRPKMPDGKFDVVLCTYVLNTIPVAKVRNAILKCIIAMLAEDGIAMVSVRNDMKSLTGYKKNGTWQGYIRINGITPFRHDGFDLYILDAEDIAPSTMASITV